MKCTGTPVKQALFIGKKEEEDGGYSSISVHLDNDVHKLQGDRCILGDCPRALINELRICLGVSWSFLVGSHQGSTRMRYDADAFCPLNFPEERKLTDDSAVKRIPCSLNFD
ncbi:hypothetical protein NHX12_008257 [Muraenolepis orangiensis]|uniref:Uncharacterized protein n=1 Tax=Muraenolepis orangiensis TaxID=630683 RepID=A0A9Q0I952_9TELE|nr:hypothetical protein NHX12_008257 [Muraenolepis orangiensis]